LLAVPDAAALPLLKDAVYHPDNLVRQYTLYALSLFDDTLLYSWIPATIQASGPTPDLAYLLSWRRGLFQPRGNDVVHAVLPYLKSASPLLTAGALQTLYFMKPQYDWKAHPEIPALLDRTVAAEAGRLIGTRNAALLQPLALYLGTWKAEASRRLLRRLVADGTVREQAEICLRWIGE
jgi:HEAT repeat protein